MEFDCESGQTNDFNIGIHSFPAWRSALKGQYEKQKAKENNSEESECRREIRIVVDPIKDSSQQNQDPSEGYNSLKN